MLNPVVNYRPFAYLGDEINSYITIIPRHSLNLNSNEGSLQTEDDGRDTDFIKHLEKWDTNGFTCFGKYGAKIIYVALGKERSQTHSRSWRIWSPVYQQVVDGWFSWHVKRILEH